MTTTASHEDAHTPRGGLLDSAEIKRVVHATVVDVMQGQTEELARREREQRHALARAILDEHQRRDSELAAESAELEQVAKGRRRWWQVLAGLAGTIAAATATVYGLGHTRATTEASVTARRVEVDGRIGLVETAAKAAHESADQVNAKLDRHIADQAKVNEASKLRGVRQEIMLEQLVERRGMKPPKKSYRSREADKAIGINPDDPLGSL